MVLMIEMGLVLMLILGGSSSSLLHPSPCYCPSNTTLIDNGYDAYPRFVTNLVCEEKKCFNSLRCRPRKYRVTILKPRMTADSGIVPFFDPFLPKSLSFNWRREHIDITVACICSF